MRKKKGSALVMSIAVIAILTILSAAIITTTAMAYKSNRLNENLDAVGLMAESGIEKGLMQLKQKLLETPDIFVEDRPFAAKNFKFSDSNINCTVTFQDISNIESQGPGVSITSTAVQNGTNVRKNLKAYILKKDISNEYFDLIFGNIFTTLDNVSGNSNTTFTMQESVNDLNLDGSMYLQGANLSIKPKSLTYTSGEIKTIASNVSKNSTVNSIVKNSALSQFNILPVLSTPVFPDPGLTDFYGDSFYTNPNPNYKIFGERQTSTDDSGNTITSLVTFKITKKSPTVTDTFDWSAFVINVKDFIMRRMITVVSNSRNNNLYNKYKNGKLIYTETTSGGKYFYNFTYPSSDWNSNDYGTEFEDAYKGMYKMYIIDGNVSIKMPSTTSAYINHIIYSPYTVTIDRPSDNNRFVFQTSSILAKRIEIKNLTNGSNRGYIELKRIKKIDEIEDAKSGFSPQNRANINRFLINHLEGYADALRFKVYKWEG